MPAAIIPSVDANVKHDAAYKKRDQRPTSDHLRKLNSFRYVERKAVLKNLNITLYRYRYTLSLFYINISYIKFFCKSKYYNNFQRPV